MLTRLGSAGMAWQSNVGGGWTNDHVAHWDRGTPPQRFEKIEDATWQETVKPDWHGKRRLSHMAQPRFVGDPMATLTQGRVVPLSPGRAQEASRRGAWPWEMPQTHWEDLATSNGCSTPVPPPPRGRGSPARHVPSIEYNSHPWGYNTLETEQIRLARAHDVVRAAQHTTGVPRSSRSARAPSTRTSRSSASARVAQEEELAATRAKIAEMRMQLGLRQNSPPQIMVVPTPGPDARGGEAHQVVEQDGMARSPIRLLEVKDAIKPRTPPTPRRPRDPRKGPNGKLLVKKEQQSRQPKPKHDFSQRALPFLKRLNTYNDPKFNFPKQKTDVTKVN